MSSHSGLISIQVLRTLHETSLNCHKSMMYIGSLSLFFLEVSLKNLRLRQVKYIAQAHTATEVLEFVKVSFHAICMLTLCDWNGMYILSVNCSSASPSLLSIVWQENLAILLKWLSYFFFPF